MEQNAVIFLEKQTAVINTEQTVFIAAANNIDNAMVGTSRWPMQARPPRLSSTGRGLCGAECASWRMPILGQGSSVKCVLVDCMAMVLKMMGPTVLLHMTSSILRIISRQSPMAPRIVLLTSGIDDNPNNNDMAQNHFS